MCQVCCCLSFLNFALVRCSWLRDRSSAPQGRCNSRPGCSLYGARWCYWFVHICTPFWHKPCHNLCALMKLFCWYIRSLLPLWPPKQRRTYLYQLEHGCCEKASRHWEPSLHGEVLTISCSSLKATRKLKVEITWQAKTEHNLRFVPFAPCATSRVCARVCECVWVVGKHLLASWRHLSIRAYTLQSFAHSVWTAHQLEYILQPFGNVFAHLIDGQLLKMCAATLGLCLNLCLFVEINLKSPQKKQRRHRPNWIILCCFCSVPTLWLCPGAVLCPLWPTSIATSALSQPLIRCSARAQ